MAGASSDGSASSPSAGSEVSASGSEAVGGSDASDSDLGPPDVSVTMSDESGSGSDASGEETCSGRPVPIPQNFPPIESQRPPHKLFWDVRLRRRGAGGNRVNHS
jgi:hypothetical protein